MANITETPLVSGVLTMLLVMRLFNAAKPLVYHPMAYLVAVCVLLGFAAQSFLAQLLFGLYLALPARVDKENGDGVGSDSVSFAEFVSLNVTMTSFYCCCLTMLVLLCGINAMRWVAELKTCAAACLPSVWSDADGKPVVDLWDKGPKKS